VLLSTAHERARILQVWILLAPRTQLVRIGERDCDEVCRSPGLCLLTFVSARRYHNAHEGFSSVRVLRE